MLHVIDRVLVPANLSRDGAGAAPAGGGGVPSGTVRPNKTAEVSCNMTSTSILPPFPTSNRNATSLGCPVEDRVCETVDFQWLQCATQRHLMSSRERERCPTNATTVMYGNGSVYLPPIPIKPRCYSPSTHVCVNNYFLCPASAPSLCGVQCYSPEEYQCYTSFSLCPQSAPLKCGEACYNAANYSCENGTLISTGGNGTGNATGGGGEAGGGGAGGGEAPEPTPPANGNVIGSTPLDDPPPQLHQQLDYGVLGQASARIPHNYWVNGQSRGNRRGPV